MRGVVDFFFLFGVLGIVVYFSVVFLVGSCFSPLVVY